MFTNILFPLCQTDIMVSCSDWYFSLSQVSLYQKQVSLEGLSAQVLFHPLPLSLVPFSQSRTHSVTTDEYINDINKTKNSSKYLSKHIHILF